MRKFAWFCVCCMALTPAAHASGLMDWLEQHSDKPHTPADAAKLLTLENKQSEMYPQPSPGGRFLLTVTRNDKETWISRRYSENGDAANVVSSDSRALDSIGWMDEGKVFYLSQRAGGLGLWEKISDGEGMQRRIVPLKGTLIQPLWRSDASIFAVRLVALAGQEKQRQTHRDPFNNWDFPGFRAEVVRINNNGNANRISEGVNPALSPDGQWIAFSIAEGRSFHLYRMRTDGSDLIQMTDARSIDVQPSWSRDGQTILFTSNRADADLRHPDRSNWDIWSIGIDGRHLQRITYDKARDGAPRMGADGRIYFHSDRVVDKPLRKQRKVDAVRAHSFHIWTIDMPAADAPATVVQPKTTTP